MQLYNYYKQVALDTGNTDHVDMNTDTVKVALLESYTFSAAHKYMSDITGAGTVVARSAALTSPTVTNGTFDAADVTLTAVTTGHTVTSLVVYKDSGADGSSTVIAYIDKAQDGTTALSLATNGSDVLVTWHASGIYDI